VSQGVAHSTASSGWSVFNVAWAITVAGVWFWTCMQLSLDWRASANYQFGYAVPWVAIFLAWQRVKMNPDCLADARRFPSAAVGLVLITAWCCLFFGELLRALDPHWRIVSWVMTLGATLLTVVWLHGRGGPKLLRQLAFPLAFAWMAVPWPTKVEDIITLRLRGLVTGVTVETLNALGISALQRGNIIDIASGAVSVDAPCAGIISLHSSLMASLFLGECFRFTLKKRAILILAGSLIAVSANLLRALALSLIVNAQGEAGMEAYHDTLGWMETVIIVLAIFGLGWCMSPKSQAGGAPAHTWRFFASNATAAPGAYASFLAFFSIPLLGLAWFALSPGGPVQMQKAPLWALRTTSTTADWKVAPAAFTPLDTQALQFSEGEKIDVRGPLATQSAQLFHFFWNTGAILSPFCHTPDICMQRVGWTEMGEPIAKVVRLGGTDLSMKLYRFEQGSQKMVVFQTVYYGGAPISSAADFPEQAPNVLSDLGSRTSRLALLWGRPRRRGLEALNLYMAASGNPEAETEAAREVLEHALVLDR
jgi:exosortase